MLRSTWLHSIRDSLAGNLGKQLPTTWRRGRPTTWAADIAVLETRSLLSAAVAESIMAVSPVVSVSTEQISDGAVIVRTQIDAADARVISPGEQTFRVGELNGSGLQFNLIAASGMTQQSIDGFQDAADLWSAILRDDILVNIDINFTALDPGVLAQAGSTTQGNSLSSVKTALSDDAKSLSDAIAVANLPAGSSLSIYTSDATTGNPELDNNATGNNTTLDVNTTVAKAIGLRTANNATVDANITFSSLFTWDFDRSDGISAGAFDFIGVVAHEIGHSLGFVSGADTVDATSNAGPSAPLELDGFRVASVLDLFRVSADSISNSADIDLRADTATKSFSIDGGTTLITTFSTGSFNGDGRQASHWKDNLGIGIMDPTAANGEYADITDLDVQAFDVIGWDVAMDLGDAPDTSSSTGTANYQTNLSDNGPRHLLFAANGNINDPTGAPKVFLGASVTGELASLQNSTATGDADNGISSLPTLAPGSTQSVTVTSSGNNAILNYFVDFNRDGDFSDAGESFNTTLTSTSQSVDIVVPAGASAGTSFARFRISTAGGLSAVGAANDGEVEDYQVTIGSGNTVPSIGGAVSNQAVNDNATISPFSALTVTDPDTQSMSATVRIQDGVLRGDFTGASSSGWTRTEVGNHIDYSRTFASGANIGATVQAAIRALVFDPRENAITPGATETTAFTVSVSDGVAPVVTDTNTSVITTSVNNVPTIGFVGPTVFGLFDNVAIDLFSAAHMELTVTDPDTQSMSATVRINNGVVRGDFTSGTGGWTRTVLGNDIQYSRTFPAGANIGSTVQAAIRTLTFTPRANAIIPGSTETTTFTVTVTDGVAAPVANSQATLNVQSANNNETLGGAANVAVNDNATVNPLSNLTVTDPDFQEGYVKVTILNGAFRGDFTPASTTGWSRSTLGNNIEYFRYFGPAANVGATLQAAARALVFQPRQNAINPGTTELTDFQVVVSDGIGSPVSNVGNLTRLTVTSVNNAPSIGGAVANQPMLDFDTILPFSALTVSDPDTQAANARVTIINGVARGDFTNGIGAGWTRTFNGNDIVYTLVFNSGSNIGSTVQAAIRALRYQPRQNVLAPGLSETTVFSVFVNDGLANTTNSTTSVVSTSSNDPPAIDGTVANQTMNDNQTKAVFSTLTIADVDLDDMNVIVTIPNGVNRGDFTAASSTAAGWTRTVVGIDIRYNRYFSPTSNIGATVQAAIRALIFQPRNNVPIGTTETTGFTVFVNDGLATATNSTTSVITTGVAPRMAAPAAILDSDVATVIVPSVKKTTANGLARLLKKSK